MPLVSAWPSRSTASQFCVMSALCVAWGGNQVAAKFALADFGPMTQCALRNGHRRGPGRALCRAGAAAGFSARWHALRRRRCRRSVRARVRVAVLRGRAHDGGERGRVPVHGAVLRRARRGRVSAAETAVGQAMGRRRLRFCRRRARASIGPAEGRAWSAICWRWRPARPGERLRCHQGDAAADDRSDARCCSIRSSWRRALRAAGVVARRAVSARAFGRRASRRCSIRRCWWSASPIWFGSGCLKRYRAPELSALTFISPVVGVLEGWLALGERPTPIFVAGARRRRRRHRAAELAGAGAAAGGLKR